jgi:hypothetical protein
MTYSELIQSIISAHAKAVGPGARILPNYILQRLVTANAVHPTLVSEIRNSFLETVEPEKLEDFIMEVFDLMDKQVSNNNFGIEGKGSWWNIPLLGNTGSTSLESRSELFFNAKIGRWLEFFNGTELTEKIVKDGFLNDIIDELFSSNAPSVGIIDRQKTFARIGKELPRNLLMFMLDMPNKMYNADFSGKTYLETVSEMQESINKYKVQEFIEPSYLDTLDEIITTNNNNLAQDFFAANKYTDAISGQLRVSEISNDIVQMMVDPIVQLSRVIVPESINFRQSVQVLRLLNDPEFSELLDNFKMRNNIYFVERLLDSEVDTPIKTIAADAINRYRKGAEAYTTLNFEDIIKNSNYISKLHDNIQALYNAFSNLQLEVIEATDSPLGNAIRNSKYFDIFQKTEVEGDRVFKTTLNIIEGIKEFLGDVDRTEYTDASQGADELGLFSPSTSEFINETHDMTDVENMYINHLQTSSSYGDNNNVLVQKLNKLRNIVADAQTPTDNGFDIFSFKPPVNEVFHAGPSLAFLEDLYNIPNIGDVDFWDWQQGMWQPLSGSMETIQDDMWKVANQLIGDSSRWDELIVKEAAEKNLQLPEKLIIKVKNPSNAISQALFGMDNKVAIPNKVNIGETVGDLLDNMDADKLQDVIKVITEPKLGSAIASTALNFAKKAGKFVGGTTISALAPGDVIIERGIKKLLPKLGLAAISTPALAAYTAYELALLAADATKGLSEANKAAGVGQNKYGGFSFTGGKTLEGEDVDYKAPDFSSYGKDFWKGFTEDNVSDKYSIGYKLTKEVHNTLFEDVYGRIAQDLYAGTDS